MRLALDEPEDEGDDEPADAEERAGRFELAGAGPEAMVHQRLWSWFDVGSLRVDLALGVDRLSAVME